MESSQKSHLPIKEGEIKGYMAEVNRRLTKVSWRPQVSAVTTARPAVDATKWRDSSIQTQTQAELSLMSQARRISNDALLLSDDVNHVLTVVRTGFALGIHLSKLYSKSTGLERLFAENKANRLTDAQKTEFRDKQSTAAVVTVFTAAAYVTWQLSNYDSEKIAGINMEFQGIPEMNLLNPIKAVDCSLFYFTKYVQDSGAVNTGLDLVKMAILYFQGVIDEIKTREGSFKQTEAFTNVSYQLVDTDFIVDGFTAMDGNIGASVEFNRVSFENIVGNREAKHKAYQLAQRLVCYDLERQQNPFEELGGLSAIRMGWGFPGTGKSMQIAATATLLHDYCELLDIPFLFSPMPDNLVSTFQGGSAERMVEWMRRRIDPTKIIYAPIDDAENNLEERSRQGVSAGVREVIGVFLRYTEGAYAINFGNSVIEVFTNLPEQVDAAVLSRIQDRFVIDGARTVNDFLDQDYLWMKPYNEMLPGFITMEHPDYEYLSDQKQVGSLIELGTGPVEIQDERIRKLYEAGIKDLGKTSSHLFFADLYHRVQQVFPKFTSRDIRNIQKLATGRFMDFDLPETWFEQLDEFFRQPYDTKLNMLRELVVSNMRGVSFDELRLAETLKYLDNAARIEGVDRERKIAAAMEQMEIQQVAMKRLS